MADEFQEDEYHFSEDASSQVFDESDVTTSQSSISSRLSSGNLKRNVLIAIGVIIILLFLYKFLGSFFSAKSTATVKAPTTKTVVQKPIERQPIVEPTQTFTQPVKTVQDPNIDRKLSSLQQNSAKTRDEITSLNDNVETLNGSLTGLGDKISVLNKSIAMLSEEVRQQQEEIARLKKKPKPPKKYKQTRPKLKYVIQAVIPGRAWLMSNKGTMITVRLGSIIPGYGKVRLIDAHQGLVLMSSGVNIIYSVSDT